LIASTTAVWFGCVFIGLFLSFCSDFYFLSFGFDLPRLFQ